MQNRTILESYFVYIGHNRKEKPDNLVSLDHFAKKGISSAF